MSQAERIDMKLEKIITKKVTNLEIDIAEVVTFFGSPYFSFILIALGFLHSQSLGIKVSLAIGLSFMVVQALKHIVKRSRPPEGKNRMKTYSFPSGHSAMAFSVAPVLTLFFGFETLFYTSAILIASSRVILREHYLSDIAAGSSIGILSGFLALLL